MKKHECWVRVEFHSTSKVLGRGARFARSWLRAEAPGTTLRALKKRAEKKRSGMAFIHGETGHGAYDRKAYLMVKSLSH